MKSLSVISLFFILLNYIGLGSAATYSNPIRDPNGSDPFIVYTGGYYYLLTTTWTDVEITRATTIEGLKTGNKKVVYNTTVASRCCNVWSPEVHYLNDTWYIYYTAGTNENLDGQRVHVLVGGATPWDPFTYYGQMTPAWGIDGTVLRFNGWGNYLVYSGLNPSGEQCIFVAPLTTPTSLGTPSIISEPTNAWEEHGGTVNEAPAALYHNGITYLTYSASSCWTQYYSLGLLTWDGKTDPALMSAWTKTGPVFTSANGNYGPGTNGFFLSPDLTETWIVYNADANPNGACDSTRYTMTEKLNWNADGSPNFGSPPSLSLTFEGPSGEPA